MEVASIVKLSTLPWWSRNMKKVSAQYHSHLAQPIERECWNFSTWE
jgi:hypothetical protein